MSNGARHALGVVAGLLLPPLVAAGLFYGMGSITLEMSRDFRAPWTAFGVLALTAIALAFLLSSRISPIATLIGGLEFTAVGLLLPLEMTIGPLLPDKLLTGTMGIGFRNAESTGVLLLLGVAMLVVSTFPSRWRASRPAVPVIPPPLPYGGPPAPSPYPPGPPAQPAGEDATRPMHRE